MTATTEKPPARHTGLKILVGVLGAMLVFGFLALIATIIYQAKPTHKAAPGQSTATGTALPSFGNVIVPIRQGERIARIQPSGDRLFIELATVDGNSRLVVLDQATGKVLGSIDFPQQP